MEKFPKITTTLLKRKQNSNTDIVQKKRNGCGDFVNDFIEDVWTVMTPEMIDQLKCVLKDDMGLSKQDIDTFINSQKEIRRKRICVRKTQRIVRIGPRNQWIREFSKDIADQMSSFIVGILLSKRTARTKRITERVLERLCEITGEETTVESAESRIERTLVVVADRMAKWIDEAITEIEKGLEDKYRSAASLEALSVKEVDLCHIVKTPISSEHSSLKSHTSLTSEESKKFDLEDGESEFTEDRATSEGDLEDEESLTEGEESDHEEEIEEEEEGIEEEEVEDEEEIEEEEEMEEEEEVEEEETVEEEMEEEELEEEEKFEEENLEGEEEDDVEGYEEVVESPSKDRSIEEKSSKDSSIQDLQRLPGDILDLLKEDIAGISREEEKSERQKAIQEIIDKRLEKIAKEKLDQSLDTLIKFDIDETASIIADWMEKVLSAADHLPEPIEYHSQGPAFEVKRGEGSQYKVYKISSTSIAKKVAEVRGLDLPRKTKVPKTMSPMNLMSGKDWADWALDASNVGEEWGDWLNTTISDVEKHLLSDKSSKSHKQNYDDWNNWRNQRSLEAKKWRAEKLKIRNEGSLWKRKFEKENKRRPEMQTLVHNY